MRVCRRYCQINFVKEEINRNLLNAYGQHVTSAKRKKIWKGGTHKTGASFCPVI